MRLLNWRLILPAACVAGALLWRIQFLNQLPGNSSQGLALVIIYLPYILLGLTSLMALASNQAMEAGVAVTMLLVYWLIQSQLQAPLQSQPAGQIFYLINLLLPCLLLGYGLSYTLMPEQSCRQPLGLAAIALSPLLVIIIGRLIALDNQLFLGQAQQALGNGILGSHLAGFASAFYLAALCTTLWLTMTKQRPLESSLLGCTLICYITFGWIHLTSISAFMFTGAGLLLSINLMASLLNIGYRDELTQIGNRRALKQNAKTLRGSYSVAMVDADFFKQINDKHGHDLGDQALRAIAALLRKSANGGKPYRYGGEEFCLLFKGKSRREVLDTLENIRREIASYDMVIRDKKQRPKKARQGEKRRGATLRNGELRLTVSIGVASSDNSGPFDQVLKRADRALYRAKARGRNQVQAA